MVRAKGGPQDGGRIGADAIVPQHLMEVNIMKNRWIVVVGSGALIFGLAVAGFGFADSEEVEIRNGTIRVEHRSEADFPSMAKISMVDAAQKALASVHGQVLKTALEDENGFLVYGVEVVAADKAIMEVKVDAGSGMVLAMERDRTDDEDEDHESDEHGHRDDRD